MRNKELQERLAKYDPELEVEVCVLDLYSCMKLYGKNVVDITQQESIFIEMDG